MTSGKRSSFCGAMAGVAIALASLSPADAVAGRRSDPAGLPACPAAWSVASNPDACVVSLVNPGFELHADHGWSKDGSSLPFPRSYDGGSFVAVLEEAGSRLSQTTRMPLNQAYVAGKEATYAMRFRLRSSEAASVHVGYRILLVDETGKRLGRVVEGSVSAGQVWEDMESIVPRRDLPEDAYIVIEFEREDDDASSSAAFIDDVSLVLRERF